MWRSGGSAKWAPIDAAATTTTHSAPRLSDSAANQSRLPASQSSSGATMRFSGVMTYIATRKARPHRPAPERSAK